jgi:hypothetical protein
MFRRLLLALLSVVILSFNLAACSSSQPQQGFQYDPAKNYSAFLVVNTPASAGALTAAKQKATGDGYEIGPVVYYEPGTRDFTEQVKKLLPGKQVQVIWVSGSLLDTPDIQKALIAAQYKGQIKYMPVTPAQ